MTDRVTGLGPEERAMAIDRVNGSGVERTSDVRDSKTGPQSVGSGDGRVRDQIELSPDARQLSELVDRARTLPEVRQETVDAIRRDLASGAHEVDPQRLARLILDFEEGLRD